MNGRTLLFGVIGDPVSHSFSPPIHHYFAERCGLNMAYAPFHVKQDGLAAAIAGAHALGIRGINVTIPHKQAVMPYLSGIDPMAEKVGSVNTLVWTQQGYIGYNTDHSGITRTLNSLNLSFEGRPVIVLGAGGSAYAACVSAASQGASSLKIINRTLENADKLALHIKRYYNVEVQTQTLESLTAHFGDNAIIIQTTTLGFGVESERSPVHNPVFFDGTVLALDIIYAPWETPFIRQARSVGVKTANGFPMLVYQAAEAFILWRRHFFEEPTGGWPPDEVLSGREAMEHLEAEHRSL